MSCSFDSVSLDILTQSNRYRSLEVQVPKVIVCDLDTYSSAYMRGRPELKIQVSGVARFYADGVPWASVLLCHMFR